MSNESIDEIFSSEKLVSNCGYRKENNRADESTGQKKFLETVKNGQENKFKDAASRYMTEVSKSVLLTKGQEIVLSQEIEFSKNSSLAFTLLFPSALKLLEEEYEKQNRLQSCHPKITAYSTKNLKSEDEEELTQEELDTENLAKISKIVSDIAKSARRLLPALTVEIISNMHELFLSLEPIAITQSKGGVEIKSQRKKNALVELVAPYNFFSMQYVDTNIYASLPPLAQTYIKHIISLAEFNVDNDYVKKLIANSRGLHVVLADCKKRYMGLLPSLNLSRDKGISYYHDSVDSFNLSEITKSSLLESKLKLIDADLEVMAFDSGLPPTIIDKLWNSNYRFSRKTENSIKRMCESNLRLVLHVAKKYRSPNVEFMDLVQEGNIGLQRAVEKFDYRMGNKFSTYATWWIKQAITRAISDQSTQIRIPAHMQELIKKIDKFTKQYVALNRNQPTESEVAQSLGVDVDKIKLALRAKRDPISLHVAPSSNNEESNASLLSLIEYDDEGTIGCCPSVHYELSDRKKVLLDMLAILPERDAKIIMMRYGFDVSHEHTLEEAGKQFNVTRERIRQLEKKGCEKLTDLMKDESLNDYL